MFWREPNDALGRVKLSKEVDSFRATQIDNDSVYMSKKNECFIELPSVPSVAEWSKALESDASAGGESPDRAPVRAATLCPYA